MNEFLQDISNFLSQDAVSFSGSPNGYDYKGWRPFAIPLIPKSLYVGKQSDGLLDSQGKLPRAFPILANQLREFVLITPNSKPYLLLDVKFAVDKGIANTANPPVGPDTTGATSRFTMHGTNLPLALLGILPTLSPSYANMDAALCVTNTGKNIYGGMVSASGFSGTDGFDATTSPKDVRIPITCLQGMYDGKGSLRTPYLLSNSASLTVTVQNRNNTTRFVNGVVFGYKLLKGF